MVGRLEQWQFEFGGEALDDGAGEAGRAVDAGADGGAAEGQLADPEVAAIIAERAVEYLEAPVKRIGGFDTPFPYTLEKIYVPDAIRVFLGIKEVMEFE